MTLKNAVIIYMEGYDGIVKSVIKCLRRYNLRCKAIERSKQKRRDFRDADLIITIGGDGTFLRTAHYIEDKFILGLNSDPKQKEGFFMQCTKNNFETRLKDLLKGKYFIKKLTRLEAKINGEEIDHTLNELYVGTKNSYKMSRYELRINGKIELQKSSGILIGTPAGSYAWLASAGGRRLSAGSRQYQFVVREPYQGKLLKNRLIKGVLNPKQKITIKSLMNDGIVVVDSLSKEYPFKKGDVITICVSNKPLSAICFRQ